MCLLFVWLPASAQAYIYWTNTGVNLTGSTIGRANNDGTGADQSFITGASGPVGLTVNASNIFWSNASAGCSGTAIGQANIDGSDPNQNFITGAACPHGLALDGSYIYWANRDGTTIGRANLDGSSPNESFITGAAGPHDVVVTSSFIYWSNYNSTTIGRANIDGSNANQSFITGADAPAGLAVSGSYIYWANNGGSTIGRANLDGSNANQSFITGADAPIGVALDGSYVYWTNYGAANASGGGGSIGRAALDGSDIDQSFITGADSPAYIAVNDLGPTGPATTASAPPPTSVAPTSVAPTVSTPPSIAGTALPGHELTCNPGTWTGMPTFSYAWSVGSKPVPGAHSQTYTVTVLDEGQTVQCAVRASNSVSAVTAKSPSEPVAQAGTLSCPKPSGSVSAQRIGKLTLGETQNRARAAFPHHRVTHYGYDYFCQYGGWGMRSGYKSGHIVLVLTGNPYYKFNGAGVGLRITDVRGLKVGRKFVIGLNDWYFAQGDSSTRVFKVRDGVIQEMGIAVKADTLTTAAQRAFLDSFHGA